MARTTNRPVQTSTTKSAGTVNATLVCAGNTTLSKVSVTNLNAAVRYLKLYDKATAPDENDTPVRIIPIPGSTALGGHNPPIPKNLSFTLGLGFRLTTGLADNDTGAVSANEHVVTIDYWNHV